MQKNNVLYHKYLLVYFQSVAVVVLGSSVTTRVEARIIFPHLYGVKISHHESTRNFHGDLIRTDNLK